MRHSLQMQQLGILGCKVMSKKNTQQTLKFQNYKFISCRTHRIKGKQHLWSKIGSRLKGGGG